MPLAAQVPGRDWDFYNATREQDVLRRELSNPERNALERALAAWFSTTVADARARMEEFGSELLTLLATVPGAFEKFAGVVERKAAGTAEAAEELVDAVVEACSEAVGEVMGRFD